MQTWGLLWGALSAGVIVGGLLVARIGLGSNPVRLLLLVNVVLWTVTVLFPLRSSIVLLAAGMAVYMLLVPVRRGRRADHPAEGRAVRAAGPGVRLRAERRAGRVAADRVPDRPDRPVRLHPVHDRRLGRPSDLVRWFGTGADRGIALVFVVTGVLGLFATVAGAASKPYRRLSAAYAASRAEPAVPLEVVDPMSSEQAG